MRYYFRCSQCTFSISCSSPLYSGYQTALQYSRIGLIKDLYNNLNLFGLSFKKARLTHWGRVMHICVGKLTIIGSDNGLAPERRQAIIWTNAGILLIGPLGTNFSEILIEIQTFSLKKIRLKMSSVKCCSFRLGLNVLIRPTLEFALAISYVLSEISRGIESDS